MVGFRAIGFAILDIADSYLIAILHGVNGGAIKAQPNGRIFLVELAIVKTRCRNIIHGVPGRDLWDQMPNHETGKRGISIWKKEEEYTIRY